MAALIEPLPPAPPEVRDLRSFTASYVEPLLQEETREWRDSLDWDFSRSADLVRRFVDLRSLNGAVLLEGRVVSGYSYYVYEEHKGLVGDIYFSRPFRTRDRELLLLKAVMQEMISAPFVTRIESQLMLSPMYPLRSLPYSENLRAFERNFMHSSLDSVRQLRPRTISGLIKFDDWADYHQEAAALLIEESYQGHVDSLINDQYRTITGARRFLYNIVNYPGCGDFAPAASLVAISSFGELAGLSLCSIVNDYTGHVTQVCVAPGFRGTGLGYELMRRSLQRLAQAGCRKVSLTVTSSNREAIRLYENLGFRTIRQFHAYVWEGWRL
ncbi:MAG TPA: GNAT family N-acetyltransferase [Bryobacteraceae bacterium]|jgi:ribosomal protein S18 acetylase RimI-like enzyme